ncbi:MAG: class I SAM-dependent methyltransferase, partial [Thermoanaerobaculia bacterium]
MPWWREHLACPDCQNALDSAQCACGFAPNGRDFRPQHPRPRPMSITLGSNVDLTDIVIERPAITYDGPRAERDSSELFSAAAEWIVPGARLLDLGCGPRDQAAPAAHRGALYVGIDYSSEQADLLADAHAIPFRDGTFDVVLSYAVLEHLYHPFLAMQEVARVLRPGGVYVGTVSQGEPFHDSYFHHTAWGFLTVLRPAGMHALRLWPSYDTLHALATMGRYPRLVRAAIEAVHRLGNAAPFLAPRKFFRWSPHERAIDELHRAASVCFVATRPGPERTTEGPPAAG